MKVLLLSLWILLSAVRVFAAPGNGNGNGGAGNGGVGNGNGNGNMVHAAPAPLLGFGIPSALAIGGVLLGAKLLRRKRSLLSRRRPLFSIDASG